MALTVGARLGSYEIVSALGAGGMGEVYRARDTKLKRDVALKVLPEAFTRDPERVGRFRREAELLASLNHPHIAHIYGLEESDLAQALVLELVEGPTLADRLTKGAISPGEALPIACQIAEALEAAHGLGIVHRDLKPANIKLRPDGTVKVLDFGIAKSLNQPAHQADLTHAPTALGPASTLAGSILGTPAYMSPEQARGKAVDKGTDIWAFGCVLYEMLTGKTAFSGETVTDTVAAVVHNEPDWQALPAGTPERLRSLIARCLKKDPAQRLRHIADGRFQIEDVLQAPAPSTTVPASARTRRQWIPWIAAALFLSTTVFLATRISTSSPRDRISFPVFPPQNGEFSERINTTLNVPSFALSPDGQSLVFSAGTAGAQPILWVRALNDVEARQLAGTEGAQDPFWSPDNRWIGFYADGAVKKIPVSGGAVQVVMQTRSDFRGATWGTRDTILVATGVEGSVAVNAAGGGIMPVTVVDASVGEDTHRNPSFLPDGEHFVYSVTGDNDRRGVYVGSLDGKTKRLLLQVPTSAVYAHPGYLLFVEGDTLLGQAFDANRLELSGRPFLVGEHVGRSTSFMSGVSATLTGTIAYAPLIVQNGRLDWISRDGSRLGSLGTSDGDYIDFRLSPDETRLAAALVDPKRSVVDMWITDLARGSTSRVLSDGGAVTAAAAWSPDGARLVYRSNRTGVIELYERSAAGGGVDRLVPSRDPDAMGQRLSFTVHDWSPDGRQLIGSAPAADSRNDLWLIPLADDAKALKYIASPAEEIHGNFSPDGRLVAYTSNESGRFEIYVETVPRSEQKWSVSTGGGYEPRWRADGRELYYLSEDRKLMAVDVGAGPTFGIPKPLFQTRVAAGVTANRTHYVPSRDGRQFLMNVATNAAASPITVVLNWTATVPQ